MKKQVSRRWRNWCQNKVYEERKEADSRDKVKHNERSDQLFFRDDDEAGRARVTTDEERILRGR